MALKLPKAPGKNLKIIQQLQEFLENLVEKMPYQYWLIGAAVVSLLLGCIMYFMTEEPEPAPVPVAENRIELVTVVAAKYDIPPRAIITLDMLKTIDIPLEAVPMDAVGDPDYVRNMPASMLIQAGDIVTMNKVLPDIRLSGFAGTIPPDCRAITIPISDITGVAGFINPGDHVDIMLVTGDRSSKDVTVDIFLQNILLLGINKTGFSANSEAIAGGGTVVTDDVNGESTVVMNSGNIYASREGLSYATLALKPNQMMELIAAAQKGTIYFAMRPFEPVDEYLSKTQYVSDNPEAVSTKQQEQPQLPMRLNNIPNNEYNMPNNGTIPNGIDKSQLYDQASQNEFMYRNAMGNSVEVVRGVEKSVEGR